MPSLLWSSVFLVVLLLPGFFFHFGLYAPGRFSRDTAPRNPLGTLSLVVLVSVLVHGVADLTAGMVVSRVDWEKVLEALNVGTAFTAQSGRRVAGYYNEARILIPLYVGWTVALGWLFGLSTGWAVVRWRIPGMTQFPWAYGLRGLDPAGGALTYAHVLSSVQHEGKVLLYRGRLQHFGLNADGTFAYIALAATEQRFLDLSRPDPYLRDRTPIGGRGVAIDVPAGSLHRAWCFLLRRPPPRSTRVVGGALMIISGASIRDVVFQSEYKIDFERAESEIARVPEAEAALHADLPADITEEQIDDEVRRIEEEEGPEEGENNGSES